MFCPKCGAQINDEAVICPNCGCATGKGVENNGKTLGIVGLILGIFMPLVGWICCGIGLSRAKKAGDSSAITINTVGLILSTVVFVAGIITSIVLQPMIIY